MKNKTGLQELKELITKPTSDNHFDMLCDLYEKIDELLAEEKAELSLAEKKAYDRGYNKGYKIAHSFNKVFGRD